jgi:hypothetical protein
VNVVISGSGSLQGFAALLFRDDDDLDLPRGRLALVIDYKVSRKAKDR